MVTDTICFHSQQTVEKLLKAYLVTKKKEFAKTHNLKALLKLCIEEDKEFNKINVDKLSFYAVELRYPDDFYIPTVEEAKGSYKIAEKVKKFVLRKLNIHEEDIRQ